MSSHFGLAARTALAAAVLMIGACSGKSVQQYAAVPAAPPQWNGVWLSSGIEMNIDGYTAVDPAAMSGPPPEIFIISPTIPWNDVMRKKVEALMVATHGDPAGGSKGAGGWGYPLMMVGPAPMQFVISPGATLMLNQYRDLREIYTDGRGHLPAAEAWPATTWGDSIGHWEGDTLVIDTIGVRSPQIYFGLNAPFSEKAHYTERLRQTAPDRIEGEMTVEDPETLTRPVKVKLAFSRSVEIERMVLDSFSNDRSGFDGKFNTIEAAKQ